MKKQLLIFILLLLPVVASADISGKCGDNVYYSYNATNHTLTISGEGNMHDYDCSRGDIVPWIRYFNTIQSVIIESGVTSIGAEALSNCDDYYFKNLTSVTIPNSVTAIGREAFYGCSGLTSITIPNSMISIGSGAFGCTGLTSITIPNSVTTINGNPFRNCIALASIQVESGNNYFDSRNNCNAIIDSNNQLILGCKNTIIPNSVTSIGSSAFSGCSGLTSITIPNNVTSIGSYAFADCNDLASVTIGNNVTSIGYDAFSGCSGLTSITIPNSVKTIGFAAFYRCSGLTSVTIGNNVEYIDEYAFSSCYSLVYITFLSGLTEVGNYCFEYCRNLTCIYSNEKIPLGNPGYDCGNYTLYVPTEPMDAYNKCSKPTISLSDGKYVFNCETPNVRYRWVISTPEGNQGYSNSGSQFTLNVFATKNGYQPSDVATYVLSGLVGDVNNDGEVNVADHVKLSEIIMEQDQ